MLIVMTRELAFAASLDAANHSMRAAARSSWNEDDYDVATRDFDRLWPLCEHGVERGECRLCDADQELARR